VVSQIGKTKATLNALTLGSSNDEWLKNWDNLTRVQITVTFLYKVKHNMAAPQKLSLNLDE